MVSLESINKVGNFGEQDGFLFTPHIRGNWGIFSTDFRLQTIHDVTGTLQTQDWQIIQFNLPIDILKISYGLGLSKIAEYDFSYFEQTVRGELRFAKRRGKISIEYRNAKKGTDEVFRRETNAFIDYELIHARKFRMSPSLMVSKQTYFDTYKQLYLGGGVNVRIF